MGRNSEVGFGYTEDTKNVKYQNVISPKKSAECILEKGADRELDIHTQINILHRQIEEINTQFIRLTERLNPVLSPEPSEPAKDVCGEKYLRLSPLAEDLRNANEVLFSLKERMNDILPRIQV